MYARVAFAKREKYKAVSPEHQTVRNAFSVRQVKRSAAEERVFLCRRTVTVKVKTSFMKIKRTETLVGAKEGRLIELVGDQNPGPEASPRSRIRRDRR